MKYFLNKNSAKIKYLYGVVSILIILFFSFQILSKNIQTYPPFGDEDVHLKNAAKIFKLKFSEDKSFKEIGEELFLTHKIKMDTPVITEYMLGAAMYLKYKKDFLDIAEKPLWNHRISYKANCERGAEIPREMLYFSRYVTMGGAIFSCIVLYLILWHLKIYIGALLASLLLFCSSLFCVYSFVSCPEIFLVLFSAFSVLFFLKFYSGFSDNRKYSLIFLFCSAVFVSFALLVKLTAIIFISYFLVFLVMLIIFKKALGLEDKMKILIISLLVCPLIVSGISYFLHPLFHSYPLTGWPKIVASEFGYVAEQKLKFCDGGLPIIDKFIIVPHRIMHWAVSLIKPEGVIYLFFSGIIILFAGGIFICFKHIKKHSSTVSFLFSILGICVLSVIFILFSVYYDWERPRSPTLLDSSTSQSVLFVLPLRGWINMTQKELDFGCCEVIGGEFGKVGFPLGQPIPERKAPFLTIMIKYLFLIGINIMFLMGIRDALRSLKFIKKDRKVKGSLILVNLFVWIILLQITFQHCDWERYYLIGVYFYYIIVGIGIGSIEKRIYKRLCIQRQ